MAAAAAVAAAEAREEREAERIRLEQALAVEESPQEVEESSVQEVPEGETLEEGLKRSFEAPVEF